VTPKDFLIGEGTKALRAAHAYEAVVDSFVRRAEIAASMLDLSEDEIQRATFLRSHLFVATA
jgi:hypothetical protein